MIEEFLVRGLNSVYYAQQNVNNDGRTSIFKLNFNPQLPNSIDNKSIYALSINNRLVAFELENYKDVLAPDRLTQ